jgi:hypothetical protein
MATPAQITANRLNAEKSTGPVTAEGKARSSQNSRTHGLTVSDETLARQYGPELEALLARYTSLYRPKDVVEEDLVSVLAHASLRLKRIEEAEAQLLDQSPLADALNDEKTAKKLDRLNRYRSSAQRSYDRALKSLEARCRTETASTKRSQSKAAHQAIDFLKAYQDLLEDFPAPVLDKTKPFPGGQKPPFMTRR